ncbi:HD domain-containing protein [Lyngbya confervoides]|uniref:HD domain-containing protein n=1 Tax=Lyngbya confervoides BDU141951 TaxID=1574623 RepID=A0ABD4T8M8_9CYAN|nr:HD domain-containing protein [Lyngbya confervoides]MCM1985142.1 HD domain-containing protein [Lyngbya confervoides BDU141951]
MAAERSYHDPLHGAITLRFDDPVEALLIQLIDTPEFQRLRRIRQLGVASLTFHGAEGSRFTHSLGTMFIARRAFARLSDRHPHLQQYRALVLCGALLHDLGHGPFSHTAEEIFQTHHEAWTQRILMESPLLQSLLDQFSPHLTRQLVRLYSKALNVPILSQLVTSQLDCDRLDYLMRDSYFTGASYGHLDLDRILLALDYDPDSQELVVARKGLAAIEHYLIVRYFMYAQVYNHPKNIAAAWGLRQAFRRAAALVASGHPLEVDETLYAWLARSPHLTLEEYLAADDIVFTYHLQRWCYAADPILRDLCQRYRDRNLFKAQDISHLDPEGGDQRLKAVHRQLTTLGLAPPYYAGIQESTMRGYTHYQRGIKLRAQQQLYPISEISQLVPALIQPLQKRWLIYPREVGAMAIS